jgi:hypothetical protein
MFKEKQVAGRTMEVSPQVVLPKARKQFSCMILNTADRLVSVFGKPAKDLYLTLVKDYDVWTHSPTEICEGIYHEKYVYKSQEMWYTVSVAVPGPGGADVPSYYQRRIDPELFLRYQQQALDKTIMRLEDGKAAYTYRMQHPRPGVPPTQGIKDAKTALLAELGGSAGVAELIRSLFFLLPYATAAQWDKADAIGRWYTRYIINIEVVFGIRWPA